MKARDRKGLERAARRYEKEILLAADKRVRDGIARAEGRIREDERRLIRATCIFKSLCRHKKQVMVAVGKTASLRMFYCPSCKRFRAVDKHYPTDNEWYDTPSIASCNMRRVYARWPQDWLVALDHRRRGF